MLSDKIHVRQKAEQDPEDIFSSSLTALFPDDTRNQHGDPDCTIIYESSRFGPLELTVADPAEEGNRKLFAHYLWNAGVYLAEVISDVGQGSVWDVKDQTVLELGAGLGLSGIAAALAGAAKTTITDYPASEVLNNITANIERNVKHLPPPQRPSVQAHTWGILNDDFSKTHAQVYSRILAADCLWMPWEHANLAKSMLHFLSTDKYARVFVVAGFHTGRAKMAGFFDTASEEGLEVESIKEVDVEGNERAWAIERDAGRENVTERKKWLAVAVLKRR